MNSISETMRIENFTYETLPLEDDYEGKVTATLISACSNKHNRPSVLYVHGFIDYFFHPHLVDFFNSNGFDFYALELRKYGHSILPDQHINYCRSIEEYFEELDVSIQKIASQNPHKVIGLGHSTGGLVWSRYLNKGKYKNQIHGLILNSPFLEVNVPKCLRNVLKPLSNFISSIWPYAKLDGMLPTIYPSSLHKDFEGEWDFDLSLKPIEGFPVYIKWSYAIMDAQDFLKKHSKIEQPILLLHSSDSYIPKNHEDRVMKSDIVLNVNHMKSIGPKLGTNVTLVEVKGGLHDLFLSPERVRNFALKEMLKWIKKEL